MASVFDRSLICQNLLFPSFHLLPLLAGTISVLLVVSRKLGDANTCHRSRQPENKAQHQTHHQRRSYHRPRLRNMIFHWFLYFFLASSASALAFALFSLTPTSLASLLATRSFLNAFSSPSGKSLRLTSVIASLSDAFLMGRMPLNDLVIPSPFLAAETSSFDESSFLC